MYACWGIRRRGNREAHCEQRRQQSESRTRQGRRSFRDVRSSPRRGRTTVHRAHFGLARILPDCVLGPCSGACQENEPIISSRCCWWTTTCRQCTESGAGVMNDFTAETRSDAENTISVETSILRLTAFGENIAPLLFVQGGKRDSCFSRNTRIFSACSASLR